MENSLTDQLLESSLIIDEELEQFSTNFVNPLGGTASGDTAKRKVVMQYWYDGYIFCLWLGLRYKFKKRSWKPKTKANRIWGDNRRKNQYLYLITKMLSEKENQIELGFDSRERLKEIGNIKMLSDKINNLANQYAFGGLSLLKELHDKNERLFDDIDYILEVVRELDEQYL